MTEFIQSLVSGDALLHHVWGTLTILVAMIVLGLLSALYTWSPIRRRDIRLFPDNAYYDAGDCRYNHLACGNSVARAFSLAGAFSLIRFRSAPGDPKDIAYVFF